MTADVDRREPSPPELTPEQLQAAAEAEAASCEVQGGGYWSKRACKDTRSWWGSGRARRCRRPGCPHHLHAWARADAYYCSGTCRMAVLRDRRRRSRDDAEQGLKRRARKGTTP